MDFDIHPVCAGQVHGAGETCEGCSIGLMCDCIVQTQGATGNNYANHNLLDFVFGASITNIQPNHTPFQAFTQRCLAFWTKASYANVHIHMHLPKTAHQLDQTPWLHSPFSPIHHTCCLQLPHRTPPTSGLICTGSCQ